MIILIPLGGIGKRFIDFGYKVPKPLIKICGDEIINKVISSLKTTKNDRIYILYNPDLELYNFESRVLAKNNKINFFKLPKQTGGPAETINIFCKFMKDEQINESVFILDGDVFFTYDVLSVLREVKKNSILYFLNYEKKPIYSYININKKQKVLKVAEKIKISDNANIGYFFKDFDTLKKFSSITIKKSKKSYVSDVFKVMLENKIDVNSIKINSKYVNILGTPEQIHDFIRNNDTNKKKIFCFDLDNTLVTYPQIIGDYTTVLPIYANIKFLRSLYDQGHKILIYTARRMRTYKSNISLVKKNIKKLTIFQLKNFKIPYHKLIFGKPYANYYIDDLSINAHENLPFALGYNYEKITSRDFNKVTIGENYTLKLSNKLKKIKNEINYYKKLPIQIRNYFPSVVGSGKNYYKLETIKGVSYSYLYINEILLDKDLDLLIKVLSKIHNLKVNKTFFKQNIYKNYYVKFNQRLKIIDLKLVNHFKKHINRIKNFLENYENEKEGKLGIVHGDTVFSNIFKTTNNTLKLIDPRAGQLNTFSMHGDIFYDYAKIYQSLTGFEEIFSYKSVNKLFFIEKKKYYENLIKDLYGEKALKNIKYLTSSLIISLIPMQDKKKSYQFLELSKNILC